MKRYIVTSLHRYIVSIAIAYAIATGSNVTFAGDAYATPTPTPFAEKNPIVSDIHSVIENASAARAFEIIAYPTYAPKLANQWGAGIALLAPIPINALGEHLFAGVRGDLLDGQYFAASAGVGLKADLNLFGVRVTPFALTGVVAPLSHAGDKQYDVGAIVGTGATAQIWESVDKHWKLSAFGEAEYWSQYPGIQIFHVGAQLGVNW
jgi:hypothetical protein